MDPAPLSPVWSEAVDRARSRYREHPGSENPYKKTLESLSDPPAIKPYDPSLCSNSLTNLFE
jgi:hypothetical protein